MKKVGKIKKATSVLKRFFTPEKLEHLIEAIIIATTAGIVVQIFVHLVWP